MSYARKTYVTFASFPLWEQLVSIERTTHSDNPLPP